MYVNIPVPKHFFALRARKIMVPLKGNQEARSIVLKI
jgi:hypothetical protein